MLPRELTVWRGPVMIIAAKEIKDSLRNRWVTVIFAIFMLLALSVTFAGSAVSGTLSFPALASVITSLSTVSVFIIPLAAILLSYDAFVGEEEAGTMLLLLSYPLTKRQIFMGKFVAHSAIMVTAITISFGLSAAILLGFGDGYLWGKTLSAFGQFILSSSLLAVTFILISYLVSVRSSEKAKAVGSLLSIWFSLVLIYDLILLALLVADLGSTAQVIVNVMMLLNPTDIYRAINLFSTGTQFGGVALLTKSSLSSGLLYMLLSIWVVLLAWLSQRAFARKAI
ncbi:ABC transporter permease [Shewanella colwelliana]|uniref:ABC transporter permease n=1 Tax=Shewanella colwelliana TaxID=23 RepID=UPI003CFFC228